MSDKVTTRKIALLGVNLHSLIIACYLSQADGAQIDIYDEASDSQTALGVIEADGYYFEPNLPQWNLFTNAFDRLVRDFPDIAWPELVRNEVAYKVFFDDRDVTISALKDAGIELSRIEPGAGVALEEMIHDYARLYASTTEGNRLNKAYRSARKSVHPSYNKILKKHFYNPDIRDIIKFVPSVAHGDFLKLPRTSLVFNYNDYYHGQTYPRGGYLAVVQAMVDYLESRRVHFKFNKSIANISVQRGAVSGVKIGKRLIKYDRVITCSGKDQLNAKLASQYKLADSTKASRQMCLVRFTLGLDCQVDGLAHHNGFYDCNWADYRKSFKKSKMPSKPPFTIDVTPSSQEGATDFTSLTISVYLPVKAEYLEEELDSLKNHIYERLSAALQLDVANHVRYEGSSIYKYAISHIKQNDMVLEVLSGLRWVNTDLHTEQLLQLATRLGKQINQSIEF